MWHRPRPGARGPENQFYRGFYRGLGLLGGLGVFRGLLGGFRRFRGSRGFIGLRLRGLGVLEI